MKKISAKLWAYGIGFLARGIMFNVALAFAITALVFVKDGFTVWALLAIVFSGVWITLNITNHMIWSKLSKNERALYFGIRRHGAKVVEVAKKEVERRSGQVDMLEIMRDTDASLEIQMLINGTGTFINVFIGIKWIHFARQFNKNKDVFQFEVVDKEL